MHVLPLLNFGDPLQNKTSEPMIKAEMLVGREDFEGIMLYQGYFAIENT